MTHDSRLTTHDSRLMTHDSEALAHEKTAIGAARVLVDADELVAECFVQLDVAGQGLAYADADRVASELWRQVLQEAHERRGDALTAVGRQHGDAADVQRIRFSQPARGADGFVVEKRQ